MKKVLFLITLCLCSCTSSAKKDVEVQWECKKISPEEFTNIAALSECYGYIRFFYPNPNLKNFDWTKFLMYSVDKIENVKNENDLKNTLLELFEPLCPQIAFSTDKVVPNTILQLPFYAIEHKAVGTMAKMNFGKSYSPIVQITEKSIDYNDVYCYKLKDNLYITFPVAVKNLATKTDKLNKLEKELKKIDEGKIGLVSALLNQKNVYKGNMIYKRLSYRIADIIIRKNYIQHFYPYFAEDKLSENWNNEFSKTVENIALTNNMNDYFMEIKKLLANINDSHINIWNTFAVGAVGAYVQYFYPDIAYSFVNDTCYIAEIGNEYKKELKKGDIVKSINNVPIETMIEQKLQEISFSTKANGLYRMKNLFESRTRDSVITITVETADKTDKAVKIKADLANYKQTENKTFINPLESNILYINLCTYDSCTYENFAKNIEAVKNSNGVIFDVRGYPSFDALPIISHFIKKNIELGNLLEPIYRFPNQEKVKYNLSEKWQIVPANSPQSKEMSKKNEYKEPLPIHIDKRIVFLTNGSAMSFAETFLDMMKHYNIGTIIGTPTAGCNGDVTRFEMTGASFFMTYNKFLNRDGSQHHGIGILPDIYCEMKISDIQNNIDTQLKKAEEFIAKQ